MAEPIYKNTRLRDLTAEDMAKPIGEAFGAVLPDAGLLAETLGRLRRANDGLRDIESGTGPWAAFAAQGGRLEAWVRSLRQEVAQAAMNIETLMSREEGA